MGKRKSDTLNQDTINFLIDDDIANKSISLEEIAEIYANADQNAVKFAESVRNGSIQLKDGQTYLEAYEGTLKSTSFSFKNLASSAMNGLKSFGATAINALGGMAISAAISLLTTLFVKWFDGCIHAKEKIQETARTAQSNIEELNSTFEETKSKAQSALETYNNLASGMDLLSNKNISLSGDEYKDFISAGNELAELFPELVQGYDANGNAILNLGDNATAAAEKINTLVDAQKQQLASDIQGELPDVFAGINQDLKDLEQNSKNIGLSDIFNNLNNSFVGTQGQLKKMQSVIKDMTGKTLAIETSVDGNSFIDTNGILDAEEQSKICQAILDDVNNLDTSSIQQAYQSKLSDIFTVLSADDTYASLGDNQSMVSALISNLDYASVADEVAGSYGNDITAYLQDNIIQPIADTLADGNTASTVQEAYKNLLSLDTDDALSGNIDKMRQYITVIAALHPIISHRNKELSTTTNSSLFVCKIHYIGNCETPICRRM